MQGPNLQISWVPTSSPACLLGAICICRKLPIEDTIVSQIEATLDSKGEGMRVALIPVGGGPTPKPPKHPSEGQGWFPTRPMVNNRSLDLKNLLQNILLSVNTFFASITRWSTGISWIKVSYHLTHWRLGRWENWGWILRHDSPLMPHNKLPVKIETRVVYCDFPIVGSGQCSNVAVFFLR